MARRGAVATVLLVALAFSGVGWTEAPPKARTADNAVTLARPPALTVDAALSRRLDVLSGSWAEQRLVKARVRLGLAVLVGLSVLLALTVVGLTRSLPAPGFTLWRRRSVGRRAPPVLRLSL